MADNSAARWRAKWVRSLALAAGLLTALSLAGVFWIPTLGHQLVCESNVRRSDAILVENFDPDYLVFERAAELQKAGVAGRVLVPTGAPATGQPNAISVGMVELMARVARLSGPQIVPIRLVEPISMNAAYQIRDFLQQERVRSIIVVTPGFRSRRSSLIYGTILGEAGITTSCVPVFGERTPNDWTRTWHGFQEVTEQYIKLQYYRFYVLPRR